MMRFIPTQVGNPGVWQMVRMPGTVHPHAGGEPPVRPDGQHGIGGSSPRRWGTRLAAIGQQGGYRFIPTQVGNPINPAIKSITHAAYRIDTELK